MTTLLALALAALALLAIRATHRMARRTKPVNYWRHVEESAPLRRNGWRNG